MFEGHLSITVNSNIPLSSHFTSKQTLATKRRERNTLYQ
jgi:hypothetical protein